MRDIGSFEDLKFGTDAFNVSLKEVWTEGEKNYGQNDEDFKVADAHE